MKKYWIIILVFAAASFGFRSGNGGIKVGTQAPDFKAQDINGKEIKLSDYHGKLVLIDFWASWCKQCRLEGPRLVKTYQKFQNVKFDAGNGFEIISISLDDNTADWKEAVSLDGYTWTNISEGKKWDADLAKIYLVNSLPANYLIDGTGKIIEKDLRGPMLENVLTSHKK